MPYVLGMAGRPPVPVLFADELGMPQIGLGVPERGGTALVLTPVFVPEHRRSWGERELVAADYSSEQRRLPLATVTPLPVAPPVFETLARFTAMAQIPEHLRDEAREAVAAAALVNTRLRLARTTQEVAAVLNRSAGQEAYSVDGEGGLVLRGSVPVLPARPEPEPGDPGTLILPSGVELD